MSSPSVRLQFPPKQRQFVELVGVERSTLGKDKLPGMFQAARYKFRDTRITVEHFVGEFKGHARKLSRVYNNPGRKFNDGATRKRARKK